MRGLPSDLWSQYFGNAMVRSRLNVSIERCLRLPNSSLPRLPLVLKAFEDSSLRQETQLTEEESGSLYTGLIEAVVGGDKSRHTKENDKT